MLLLLHAYLEIVVCFALELSHNLFISLNVIMKEKKKRNECESPLLLTLIKIIIRLPFNYLKQ